MVLEFFEMTKTAEEIKYSTTKMYVHTTLKGIQLGWGLGFVAGFFGNLFKRQLFNVGRLVRFTSYGPIFGIAAASGLCYNKLADQSTQQVAHRVWRLQRHDFQNRKDNAMVVGMLLTSLLLPVGGPFKRILLGGLPAFVGCFVVEN